MGAMLKPAPVQRLELVTQTDLIARLYRPGLSSLRHGAPVEPFLATENRNASQAERRV
jgi:hypothetical protein